jgi:hypothetical protein
LLNLGAAVEAGAVPEALSERDRSLVVVVELSEAALAAASAGKS